MKRMMFAVASMTMLAGAAHADDKVTLQLKWVTQAQFAGYYAAKDKGFYKAEGADVHVNTGDQVHQKADWEAGGANASADWFAKAHGGTATSNGSQNSQSGHDTSDVDASTTAYQTNFLAADMSQSVAAGIGGDGGNGNTAKGGDVDLKIESANLNDVLNHSEHFHIDDFVHV